MPCACVRRSCRSRQLCGRFPGLGAGDGRDGGEDHGVARTWQGLEIEKYVGQLRVKYGLSGVKMVAPRSRIRNEFYWYLAQRSSDACSRRCAPESVIGSRSDELAAAVARWTGVTFSDTAGKTRLALASPRSPTPAAEVCAPTAHSSSITKLSADSSTWKARLRGDRGGSNL